MLTAFPTSIVRNCTQPSISLSKDDFPRWYMHNADFMAFRLCPAFCRQNDGIRAVNDMMKFRCCAARPERANDGVSAFYAVCCCGHGLLPLFVIAS